MCIVCRDFRGLFPLKDICKRIHVLSFSHLTFQTQCSPVRSSTLSASGKLSSLSVSTESFRSPLAAHRALFPTATVQLTSAHNWTVFVTQTLMYCVAHPLRYRGRNLCQPVLFIHNRCHSSEG